MKENFKRIIKAILIFLMFILIFSAGFLIYEYLKDSNGSINDESSKEEMLFLLAGVDSTGESTGTRTDTLMLVKADLDNKKVDMISIPRDTYVNINGQMDKINAAHSYGGIDLTMDTLREFLGIRLNYYMVIDFKAVISGIEAMGGIDINVSEEVANAMGIEAGAHHFDGEQALNFVRFRKGYENADLGRISTQQEFMKQFIKEATSAKNIPKLPFVYSAMKDEMNTNIPFAQLSKLAFTFKGASKNEINSIRLDGEATMIDGISYYEVYDSSIEDIRNNYLYNFTY